MEDKIIKAWQQAYTRPTSITETTNGKTMENEMMAFDTKIKKRDFREILVAIAMIPFFLVKAYMSNSTLELIGSLIIAVGCLCIIAVFKRVKSLKQPKTFDMDTKAFLSEFLNRVQVQIKLIKNIAIWYLGPLYLGLTFLFWGGSNVWFMKIVLQLLLTALYYWIYRRNQKAVQNELKPLEAQLQQKIAALSEEG
jgi:hypothetical protein